MQCKKCEYLLWNLKARQCPECGEPFAPSQFDFVINSVRFCCPHCNQSYYGTGERGHLVPREFECVTCRKHITMDETYVLPAEGVTERQTQVTMAPWLERQRVGRVAAWFKMVGSAMVLPHRLIRGVPATSSSAQAWWFAILTAGIFCLVAVAPFALFIYAVSRSFSGAPAGGAAGVAIFLASSAGFWIGGWVSIITVLTVWTAVTHGVLLITGPLTKSIGRTFHAMAYSIGCVSLICVPCFGLYFSFIPGLWWMISAMVMMTIAHDIPAWRGIVATGTFPVLAFVAFIGLIVFAAINNSGSMGVSTPGQVTTMAVKVNADLANFLVKSNGKYPSFGLATVEGDIAQLSKFITEDSSTEPDMVIIGEDSLVDLMQLPPGRLAEHLRRVGQAMPEDVIAHRIGDFVFTYHGIGAPSPSGSLWTLVLVPDGELFINGVQQANIRTVNADNMIESYTNANFGTALRAQNELRSLYGLPELPDLKSITLDAPVVRANGVREQFPIVSDTP